MIFAALWSSQHPISGVHRSFALFHRFQNRFLERWLYKFIYGSLRRIGELILRFDLYRYSHTRWPRCVRGGQTTSMLCKSDLRCPKAIWGVLSLSMTPRCCSTRPATPTLHSSLRIDSDPENESPKSAGDFSKLKKSSSEILKNTFRKFWKIIVGYVWMWCP